MPARVLTSSIALIAAIWSTDALAQTSDRVAESSKASPPGYIFEVGFSASAGLETQMIEVFSAADHDAPNDMVHFPRIFAARVSGRSDGRVGWTNSRECPALYGVLQMVLDQPPARLTLPNLYGAPPDGAVISSAAVNAPDGGGATIWGRARQPSGQWATLVVESHGGEIFRLATTAEAALAECWVYAP